MTDKGSKIESLQERISELESELSWRVQDAAQIANAFVDVFNLVGHITEVSNGFNRVEHLVRNYEGREDELNKPTVGEKE